MVCPENIANEIPVVDTVSCDICDDVITRKHNLKPRFVHSISAAVTIIVGGLCVYNVRNRNVIA